MKSRMLVVGLLVTFVACSDGAIDASRKERNGVLAGDVFKICPGPEAQDELLRALFNAQTGDTIQLCEGTFEFTREIPIHDKRGITLEGAGRDQTILSFSGSTDSWGVSATRMQGFTLQGMTVRDAPSIGVIITDSQQTQLRNLRVAWTGWESCTPSDGAADSCSDNGDVGAIFEHGTDHLVEDSEFYGAKVFGLAFITPRDILVRRVHAERNVGGIIIGDAKRGRLVDSVMTRNTTGLLVLDGAENHPHSGKVVIENNRIYDNNTPNFVKTGSGFAAIPAGIGVLMLALDQYELLNNEITDNGSTGLAMLNYGLLDPQEEDMKFDFYPEGINIHHNLFRDNGGDPAEPDPRAGPAAAVVPLILARNGGKSAQIVWDGGVDAPNGCDEVPRDERGVPLNRPNPDSPRPYARTDERGRPNFTRRDLEPNCRWNAWKFDQDGELKGENWIYIDNNLFERTRPETQPVDDFVNFHVTATNEQGAEDMLTPASNDLSPHEGSLPSFETGTPNLPYVIDKRGAKDRINQDKAAKACAKDREGVVNWEALLRYNCTNLADYGLFTDPEDPRSNPTERGMLYKLNSALFSDYAVKYRFIFVPPGERIRYTDYAGDPAVAYDDNAQRPLDFPVGSVIVKTFAFRKTDDEGNTTEEDVVETRLLIKRQEYDRVRWIGMAYRWEETPAGRVARLVPEGVRVPVSFDYLDEDPAVVDENGVRRRYTGSTEVYEVPAAERCGGCHGGTERDPGASPISAKPRHINREESCAATGSRLNQLDCLVATGLLQPLPAQSASLERMPRWNVPGDAGAPVGSSQDVHKRMRAYLEINCSYCHSPDGRASPTHMFLDSFRPVDHEFGICQEALLAGNFGGRRFDIDPGNADASVLHHRDVIDTPLRMPPMARSLVNEEASTLMIDWIDRALTDPSVEVEDTRRCDQAPPRQ